VNGTLTAAELSTLAAVCEGFVPSLSPEGGDEALFRTGPADVGVLTGVEEQVARLDPDQRRLLGRFLRILDSRLGNWLLTGYLRPFSRLSLEERERGLLRLATSWFRRLRRGFQAVRRLATFNFYSQAPQDGTNPTWPALDYHPDTTRPARSALLNITHVTEPTALDCDVCVIGSGAGGGVAAAVLAETGQRVVVLEAGSGQQAPDFARHEGPGSRDLYLDGGAVTTSDLGVSILAGGALGGGTTVNWQTCLRLPDEVRDEWASVSGCRYFAEESFTRSLDAVEQRIGVNVTETRINPNNDCLRRGCEVLGWRWRLLPRNARECDAALCGQCVFGCPHGAKQSTAVTFLHDAQRHGATILTHCRADRVAIANGRVEGVTATGTDGVGRPHAVTVRCPVVVAAAGALHTPALLLRSGLRLPALGRHLTLHPATCVLGVYDEPIRAWQGQPQSVLCDMFASLAGPYGFRLEAAPIHPGLAASAIPWHSARAHRRRMQQLPHTAGLIALVRDRPTGRVRLSSSGRPVIDYRPGASEQEHLRHGVIAAARVHLAAGAREVLTLHTRQLSLRRGEDVEGFARRVLREPVANNWCGLFSAHQMGTCRIGRDPRVAVCDGTGQVFGVTGLYVADASAFPASSGVNPMLTIMALAHHTAQTMTRGREW
jgi:choline dehydrogenase-like flavoprotein